MKIRYSYLAEQFSNTDDLWKNLKNFVKTGDFTLGKPLQVFEKKFAKLIGTKYAVGVNSGTDAIKLSLKTLGIKAGDEIITAANTFVATVGAIQELGAKPVFVDCDDSFCMNVSQIEKKITRKTKAIVPVHFTGYMTDMIKIKKISKKFNEKAYNDLTRKLNFELTNDQKASLVDINKDLSSKSKMFRLLQGDVGSGKTIVSLISALSVVNSKFQVALMAPTEILARQHYNLAKKLFPKNVSIELLSSKCKNTEKKRIIKDLKDDKIKMVFGTHAIFQKKIIFANLGYIIIDEQHKFGVRQRKLLSDKGGNNCDILLMSATPIPRTLTMSVYGDMDVSLIKEKPSNRKEVKTYSKLESKIDDVLKFVKKEINEGSQIFWVCPLIEESKKIDHQSSVNKFNFLEKIFPNKVALLHGKIESEEKEKILNKFLNKDYSILVSTTIIEVGIDFPNANVIIIENANKFGLSQLHQLRGRVGRGTKQASCILMFKSNLSVNAKKRINILKNSNDGFEISEEDMKLRGFGDLLGFKQSGIKNFRLADPIQNEDLFLLAEKEINKMERENSSTDKYKSLLKLYDQADIINDLV